MIFLPFLLLAVVHYIAIGALCWASLHGMTPVMPAPQPELHEPLQRTHADEQIDEIAAAAWEAWPEAAADQN